MKLLLIKSILGADWVGKEINNQKIRNTFSHITIMKKGKYLIECYRERFPFSRLYFHFTTPQIMRPSFEIFYLKEIYTGSVVRFCFV